MVGGERNEKESAATKKRAGRNRKDKEKRRGGGKRQAHKFKIILQPAGASVQYNNCD